MKPYNTFIHGSAWIRADFHLHTRKDGEFRYAGEENKYLSSYIDKLKEEKIQVGIITNHNKFDYEEYKVLRKKALTEEIFLLPGVELSVGDGKNGIHTLIIFSDEWISNGECHVNSFLSAYFSGKSSTEYEQENGRSQHNVLSTIKMLEAYHKDFFLVFAHVEQDNGLWSELDGGRLIELGNEEAFAKYVLGFQKVRTHDVADRACRKKVKDWLKCAYPAEVEGSDCKDIDGIGKGESCFIKIGYFSFEAVKFALMDYCYRLSTEIKSYQHSHLKSIAFEGGLLSGTEIQFSPELNTLIGIRGSGKSAIIESLRYALNVSFGEKAQDRDYKDRLIPFTLRSGGKIIVKAIDKHGMTYEIRRILNQQPEVFIENVLQPGISIRETVIHRPVYFGQKDLSSSGEGFEKDLVEKLIGEKLTDMRLRIDAQKQKVRNAANSLIKMTDLEDRIKENEDRRKDAEHKLSILKKYGIEEKLQKQLDFDHDERMLKQSIHITTEYISDMQSMINKHEDELKNQARYKSKQNTEFFETYFKVYDMLLKVLEENKGLTEKGKIGIKQLESQANLFLKMKEGLKEEFAAIERKLTDDLKAAGAQAVRSDEFKQVVQVLESTKRMIEELNKQKSRESLLKNDFLIALSELDNLWHEEFQMAEKLLEKVNENHSSLKIKVEYKGEKSVFLQLLKSSFKGSNTRESVLEQISSTYADFGAIYKAMIEAKEEGKVKSQVFMEYFFKNLPDLVTFQVPNRYIIEYQGKELKNHSLGQRASALILFVLSQGENDVIIIDQPEDDLDNQTIYQDVIKLIRNIKCKTQFIFATHNPNIPVLGDAEQIFACSYAEDKVNIITGSIDSALIQQSIVNIMEGGKEAINRRKEIYALWTRPN